VKLKKMKDSWFCKNCGYALNQDEITRIKSGVPISCHHCNHTITIDRYLKSPEHDTGNNESAIVHPVGQLSIRQKVVPLDVEIQKFGDARGDSESHDYYAPATFQDMSDSKRLDAPSFEKVCPFCGHKNGSGSSVCENCGASI
jgi:hypothetical protein